MINRIQNKHTLKTKHKYKSNGGTLETALPFFALSAGCLVVKYVLYKIQDKINTCKVCKKVIRDEKGRSIARGGSKFIKYEISTGHGCGSSDLHKESPICPDCWSKMIRERISIQGARLCRRTDDAPDWVDEEDEEDEEDKESKYKQQKITKYFKKNSNSPSRNSPSRNSPPKFLDGNRRNNKIKEEINKNYPELTSIQKENLYKTLLQTELLWKKGGKKKLY